MANTRGFRGLALLEHHADHKAEFGMVDLAVYAQMADDFWSNPMPTHFHECKRRMGDVSRFDPATDTIGVVDSRGYIRTFFRPIPCVSLPAAQAIAWKKLGKCHSEADNLTYFIERCKQW
jgi:pyocin large subunit-like protein